MKKSTFTIACDDGTFKEVDGYTDTIFLMNGRSVSVGFDKRSTYGWCATEIRSGTMIPIKDEFRQTRQMAKEYIETRLLSACESVFCGERYEKACERLAKYDGKDLLYNLE